jgi:hypothetical protein
MVIRVGLYQFFCSNGCYNDFADKHAEQIIRIAPRHEPLETPIEVKTGNKTRLERSRLQIRPLTSLVM